MWVEVKLLVASPTKRMGNARKQHVGNECRFARESVLSKGYCHHTYLPFLLALLEENLSIGIRTSVLEWF